jgi:hypothetical protein
MTHAQDEQLITALMQGATIEQAARATGYSDSTVKRRMATDAFRRQLAEAQGQVRDRAVRALVTGSAIAVRTLVEAATSVSVPWSVRVRAATALLDHTIGRSVAITGPGGGPVQIDVASPRDDLLGRLERLRERSIPATVIEAVILPVTADENPEDLG